MLTKKEYYELCEQKGKQLLKEAQDFINKDSFKRYDEESGCKIEYGSGSRFMPRGYYCPSLILDTVVDNAKRGKLLSRITERSKPSHKFVFNEENQLITAEDFSIEPQTKEYLVYEADRILGFSFDSEGNVTYLSEEIYADGALQSYFHAFISFAHHISVCNLEEYEYSSGKWVGADHVYCTMGGKQMANFLVQVTHVNTVERDS